jgi:hypothetical protein
MAGEVESKAKIDDLQRLAESRAELARRAERLLTALALSAEAQAFAEQRRGITVGATRAVETPEQLLSAAQHYRELASDCLRTARAASGG